MKAKGYRKGQLIEVELAPIDEVHSLEATAAMAFVHMREHAKRDGITLVVNAAFRTSEHQQTLWNKYIRACAAWENNGRKGSRPTPAARPGYSNHQAGTAIDLNRAHDDTTDNGIADGLTDAWLNEHAAEYGFRRTVASEPWHWEYLPEPTT